MYQLRYLEQAKVDLIQIKRYIAKESGSNRVAVRYTEMLRQKCRRLAELPGTMGRARPELMEGIRSLPYGNYIILFRYRDSLVEIISIIEGHRDIEEMFRS
jgi:plasmid stabilization system protein ParE